MTSREDSIETTGRIADIAKAGLPLASGLRALSEEIPSRELRQSLSELSRRLESGEQLEAVLSDRSSGVPWHLRGLLQAGLRTGKLASVLEQYLLQARRAIDHRRDAMLSLLYPLILVLVVGLIVAFLFTWIVPQFSRIFQDFGTELPGITIGVVGLADFILHFGLWVLLALTIVAVGGWVLTGVLGKSAWRRKLICLVPFYGPLLRYASLGQFCHVLAMLIENRVALPDALRMAGQGCNDAELEAGALIVAVAAEKGVRLEEAAYPLTQFPSTLLQVFRWEGRQDAFPDALHAAGDVFDSRAKVQSSLIGVLTEPVVIAGVAVTVGTIVVALFMPLIKLLNDLS